MEIARMTKGILPAALVLCAAGCAAAPREAVDLPPPCVPEVAARALGDSGAVTPPAADALMIPPDRAAGTGTYTYRITVLIGVDGRVVPGSVRVAGPEDPRFTARLVRWAAGLRFRPATFEGCAVQRETEVTVMA
jgi:hypothetical protein